MVLVAVVANPLGGLGDLLGSVKNTVHLNRVANETSAKCTWYLPESHYLEAWGDAVAFDGTYAVQQPLVAPLFGTWSANELLSQLTDGAVIGDPIAYQQFGPADERDDGRTACRRNVCAE